MHKLKKGFLQVYTGNGKGKTTAAVGLAVRAAGDGYKVIMVQFLKGGSTGELNSAKLLEPNFAIMRFEKPRGFFWTLKEEEKLELKREIQEAYEFCISTLKEEGCDILILDEVMGALSNKLLCIEQIQELISLKPDNMELVLTGRNAPQSIIDKADLVTEMKQIKHYFEQGISSREGIEY
ncbi:MAG: cob(I)yrinic acid a,c-diamide adenosyltransferase [Clostridiaceae bacterium]|nr:cob(I)yrinic acid a,c-diamide adenosyltransferase [Clostridiaceae bacterium]